MYGPRSELVAALTFLRVGLRLFRCASTTAPMALSCGVSTACMCARRPSPDQRPRHVCRAAAYSGGCREVVARPRDNLALSLTARQPRPLGEVVARYRATTSPLIRGGPHPLSFDRATTSPTRRGCRAVPGDNLALLLTARQPRPLGEVVARTARQPGSFFFRATTWLFFDRATTSPPRRGCRATARQPRSLLR